MNTIPTTIHSSWLPLFQQEFSKDYIRKLLSYLDQQQNDGITIYPPTSMWFKVFEMPLSDIKLIGEKNIKDYRYVFFEIPAIIGSDLPIQILKEANLSLLVLKANRTWNKADAMALASYSKIIEHQVSSILNGADEDLLESIIGEIPKKRSQLRKKIKKLAKLQFTSKQF